MHYFQTKIILTRRVFLYFVSVLILVPYYNQLYNSSVKPTASRARWLYCCLYSGSTGFESRLEHPMSPVSNIFLGPSREQKNYDTTVSFYIYSCSSFSIIQSFDSLQTDLLTFSLIFQLTKISTYSLFHWFIKVLDVSTSVLRESLFISIDFSCGIQKLLNEVFIPFKRRKATAQLLSWISQ
jgi:hypothetical protein